MTDLRARLSRLHEVGLARTDIELIVNPWTPAEGTFRPSAVLAAVTDRPDPGVLLLYRPDTMRSHAGHIAFPGGKIDPGETIEQAALREADEELGIDPAAVRLVGQGDMLRTGTQFEIHPVIGVVPADIAIRPNPHEVADWFEAPLSHLLDPANHIQETVRFGDKSVAVWAIRWNGHRIWGATAMILINIARRFDWAGNGRK